jgi:hypothetical protein
MDSACCGRVRPTRGQEPGGYGLGLGFGYGYGSDAEAPGILSPWYADEWKRVLSLPTDELCGLLVADTEVARTLRQTTPSTAVIPPRERWGIWRRVAEEARSGGIGEGHGAGGGRRMTRQQLEHIIRASAQIADDDDIVVIGSQAVLGQYPAAPADLRASVEADVYPPNHPERAPTIPTPPPAC